MERLISTYALFAEKPTFWSIISGTTPKIVNIHIKRHPISTIPKTEEGLKQWCYDKFKEKDEYLEYFKQHNHFPGAENKPFLGPGMLSLVCHTVSGASVMLIWYL